MVASRLRHPLLASLLRGARLSTHLKQKEAAKLAGVSASFLCQVEKGKKKPKDAKLRRLASIYGIRPDELFRLIGRPPLMTFESLLQPPPAPKTLTQGDPLLSLEEEEAKELQEYLAFMRWKKTSSPK